MSVFLSFDLILRSVTLCFPCPKLFFFFFFYFLCQFVQVSAAPYCVGCVLKNTCVCPLPALALIDTRARTRTRSALLFTRLRTPSPPLLSLSLSLSLFLCVFTRCCEFTIMVIHGCRRCPLLPGQQDSWRSRSFLHRFWFLFSLSKTRNLKKKPNKQRSTGTARFPGFWIFLFIGLALPSGLLIRQRGGERASFKISFFVFLFFSCWRNSKRAGFVDAVECWRDVFLVVFMRARSHRRPTTTSSTSTKADQERWEAPCPSPLVKISNFLRARR